jgi:AAA domain
MKSDYVRDALGGWRDHTFTAAQLRLRQFPPVSYVVPGLLPEGLSIIAGRPKIGKSWLALDIGIAIAAGRYCLGQRKPAEGDVLYAALEDNPRRLQRRIDKLLSPFNAEWPERLMLTTSWRRLDKGGVEGVEQWIKSVAQPRLVILDTLAGVRPIRTTNGYTEDYDSLASLHHVVNEYGVAAAVLHHTRKMEAEDPIDTVSGTLGLSGCADTIMVLNRTSQGTTLYVRGRDVEEAEHAITFDRNTCRWTIIGDAAEVHRSAERTRVLEALKNAPSGLTVNEIKAAADIKSRDAADKIVQRMAAAGQIEKVDRGKYQLPQPPDSLSEASESPIAPEASDTPDPTVRSNRERLDHRRPAATTVLDTSDNRTDRTGGSELWQPALGTSWR